MKDSFRLALILPQGPMHRHTGRSYRRSLRYAPLSLATLAGLIPDELDVAVKLIDEGIEAFVPETLEADLVGLSLITGTAVRGYAMADAFRRRGSTVVLGGTHVSLMPEEAARHADSIVVGAAEETWPQLLRDYASGRLQPLYRQSEGFRYRTGTPRPRRDLLPRGAYVTANTIQATRGCCHLCDFCAVAAASGRRILRRPVRDVVAEIESLPGRYLLFLDPSPMEDPRYARELYRALTPLRRIWAGCATTQLGRDPALMDLAAASGCRGLLVGFESLDQEALDGFGKGFSRTPDYAGFVRALHRRGIAVQGCFVFGSDNDRPDVFDRTVAFVRRTCIDIPEFSVYTPFPGTPAFARLERQGRIRERNWSFYDAEHVVFEPARMSRAELEAGLQRAWREAYSLPSIARRTAGSRCLLRFSVPANLGYRRYAAALPRLTGEVLAREAAP